MEILQWVGIFAVSLTLLLKASGWFIDAAEKIGLALGIPPFIVGVTIVAAGTSLPELASSIASIYSGSSEIVVGNAVGSNITNIFFVLGIVAIVGKKIRLDFDIMNVDMPFLIGSSFLLYFILMDLQVSLVEAIILLIGLALFLTYSFSGESESGEEEEEKIEKTSIKPITYGIVLVSGFLIFVGAKYTVMSIEELALMANIGKDIIALSLVAFGTSLPEVMVSIAAARKGKPEIAVGNVLGSNVFNTFAVMGIPALLGDLVIPASVLTFSLPFMIGASLMFYFVVGSQKVVTRWEGALLCLFYVLFIAGLVEQAI